MSLIKGKSKKAFGHNVSTEMDSGKPQKQALAIAFNMKRKAKKMAEGGKVGGAETSTTGNKTKTGGSNPGGASTGGAGTVTITARDLGPEGIRVSDVGGNTESRNAGGMDPSDENDDMMKAEGGEMKSKKQRAIEAFHGMMAEGGMAEPADKDSASMQQAKMGAGDDFPNASDQANLKELDSHLSRDEAMMKKAQSYADGGDVDESSSMVDQIMAKMSKGGQVANQDEAITGDMPNEFDDLHLRDDLEFSETEANSGADLGNAREDKDRADMVAQIMKSRAKKDRLPNPR